MEELYKTAVLLIIYKISCVACGSLFAYLGFKLFVKGFNLDDGELKFEGLNTKLYLKRIGPGIFFALFGMVIICTVIFQPLQFQSKGNGYIISNSSATNQNANSPAGQSTLKKDSFDKSTSNTPEVLICDTCPHQH